MARLTGLIESLEAALDRVDEAQAHLDAVKAEAAAATATARAEADRVATRASGEVATATAAHAEVARAAEALKADLQRDFDALLGRSGGGRVRQ